MEIFIFGVIIIYCIIYSFLDSEWGRKYLAQQELNVELNKQLEYMKEKMKQLAVIEPDENGGSLFFKSKFYI